MDNVLGTRKAVTTDRLASAWLRTADQAGELLHWEVPQLSLTGRAHQLRDVKWASCSAALSWECQGVWDAGSRLGDVQHADQSPDGKALATAHGPQVKLFRQVYEGHGGTIAA
ncbi:hypothetical protein T484DRAFT_1861322, partial [Baffinella frigidus]